MTLFFPLTGLQFTKLGVILSLQRVLLVVAIGMLLISQLYLSSRGRSIKYDLVFVLIISLCMLFAVLTLSNKGSLSEYTQKVSYLLGPWLYIAVFGATDQRKMLKCCYLSFFIMALANGAAVLLTYEKGGFAPDLGTYWLFGQRTYMRNILFPALFFSLINDRMNGRHLSAVSVFLMIQNPVVLYLVDSMTSCMLSVLIDAAIIALQFGRRIKSLIIVSGIANLFLSIAIIILRKVEFIADFIINVLHRDLTFSGRVVIWDLALEEVSKSPLLGTGFHSIDDNGLVLSATKNVSNAHNELLDVAYKGGLLALAVFVALIGRCCIPLVKNGESWFATLLSIFLGSFFIEAVVADIWYPQFFLLLFMSAYFSLWDSALTGSSLQASHHKEARHGI